jgi:uncharacterized protein YbaR (Trm112 family)
MPISVVCPACMKKLLLPEEKAHKRLRCPYCANSFTLDDALPELKDDPDERLTTRPAATVAHSRPVEVGPIEVSPIEVTPVEDEPIDLEPVAPERRPRGGPPAPAKRRRGEQIQEIPVAQPAGRPPEEEPELLQLDEESPRRPARPGRRPGKGKRSAQFVRKSDSDEQAIWPWWAFGAGGVGAVMMFFLFVIVFTRSGFEAKGYAAYMILAVPISTVLFFVAMYLSSVLLGAMEIGDIRVAIPKAIILVFFVNLVNMIPVVGVFLTLFVWLAGLFALFRLDLWEARMLLFFNWLLNWGIRFVLMAALLSWAMGGGARLPTMGGMGGGGGAMQDNGWQVEGDDGGPPWTEDDVKKRGGTVRYDPRAQEAHIVIAISFRDGRVTDADLAHMGDFPALTYLDVSNNPITDRGIEHLLACPDLKILTVRATKVTDRGARALKNALPRLTIDF